MTNERGYTVNRTLIRVITSLHKAIYRLTGGAVGGMMGGLPNLLLTTTGRKSGRQFTTPLLYLPDGADFVVVASYGGNPRDPQWWQNLKVKPDAQVQVGSQLWSVRATEAGHQLKQKLWPVFCRHYPGYLQYQSRTDRVSPLVVLTPTEP